MSRENERMYTTASAAARAALASFKPRAVIAIRKVHMVTLSSASPNIVATSAYILVTSLSSSRRQWTEALAERWQVAGRQGSWVVRRLTGSEVACQAGSVELVVVTPLGLTVHQFAELLGPSFCGFAPVVQFGFVRR